MESIIMDNERFITPKELSERFKKSIRTLANDRSKGKGPAYFKLHDGTVVYNIDDVIEFEEKYMKPKRIETKND